MMTRQNLMRATLAVALAAGLSACGQMRTSSTSSTSSNLIVYEATLTGTQEVPPIADGGSGRAEVRLDTQTQMLSWSVTHKDMSGPVIGAHIHGPAPVGQSAGVMVPFTGPLDRQPITGQAKITAEQAAALANGLTYVNLHTTRHPGGELRGQLRPRR